MIGKACYLQNSLSAIKRENRNKSNANLKGKVKCVDWHHSNFYVFHFQCKIPNKNISIDIAKAFTIKNVQSIWYLKSFDVLLA